MTADTVGGVWQYALELIGALVSGGTQVTLATMGAALSPDQRTALSKLRNVDHRESVFKLEWMDEPWCDLQRAGEWLLEIAADVRPDIVHLNSYVHAALTFNAPKVVVGHSCVLSWWRSVKQVEPPAEWTRYEQAVRRGLHSADAVVAPTRAMLLSLYRHYGILRNVRVIANGRAGNAQAHSPKQDLVLAVGRAWDEAKNIATLDAVAPELPWPVFVAGATEDPAGRRLELAHVHCLGRLSCEALDEWYARASIYTLPARYEPFGLSVLEAALSGCALVLGDIQSMRENWDGAAIFVAPDDRHRLRNALAYLTANPSLRERLAWRARIRARRFTPQRMASAYRALYHDMLTQSDALARAA